VVGAVEKEGRMSAERDRQDRLYKQLREAEAERSTRKLLIVMVPIVSRLLWSEVKLFGLKVEHLLLSGYWWRRNRG
jgi:ABC-type siderophore export system fused ATPase/permease subunit